jgi:hypothetical protein
MERGRELGRGGPGERVLVKPSNARSIPTPDAPDDYDPEISQQWATEALDEIRKRFESLRRNGDPRR